jgi:Zn-dependent peptidase ImmA (M78 family)
MDEDLKPTPNLIETIKTMEKRQSWMKDYLIEKGQEPLSFVNSVSNKENPVEVARKIKMKLGIKDSWASECKTWEEALKFLFKKVEEAGILVMISGIVGGNTKRKLDVNEFRGFVLIDDYAPLIFINGSDSKAAQMFTFAHELAHVWYGKGGIFDLANLQPADDQTELACDRTAAEFLVPLELFLKQWEFNNESENRFNNLAKFFKVSEIVIARRALDLSLIPKEVFFDFYQEYQERLEEMKANKGSGGDYYNTQRYNTSDNFAKAVVSSANSGAILYNEAYRLTNMSPKSFSKFSEIVESY